MTIKINQKDFDLMPKQSIIDNQKNPDAYKDMNDVSICRDETKCIGCSACRTACMEYNHLGIPVETKVGESVYYRPDGKLNFSDSSCTRCGQCTLVCPTNCLTEKDNIEDVKAALADPAKTVIAQLAPSVRVSVSESFGLEPALNMEKEMVAALKQMGFDYVFDVNVGADFTTYEEAFDLLDRLKEKDTPMFTSCCPARVKYIEDFHPEYINNITSVRTPQQCLAVLIKTYFAQLQNLDPKNIVVVSIMPCTAKKFESRRSGEDKSGFWDVDWVLTTREFIRMIKKENIDLAKIEPQSFDSILGEASGAGAIYGATGGVMESALRTAAFAAGKPLEKLEIDEVRGMDDIKRVVFKIGDQEVKIAVAATLANAEIIINEIKNGVHYDYVEVMACPGGCVGGGGQPKPAKHEIIDARRKALYEIDKNKTVRTAHENPIIEKVYKEFLHCPGSAEAKKYLHTDYDKSQVRVCSIEKNI
ncbi:MAG: [FeFe] hydrogenase, group A [Candidatus Berkelbacteria bacterium]